MLEIEYEHEKRVAVHQIEGLIINHELRSNRSAIQTA